MAIPKYKITYETYNNFINVIFADNKKEADKITKALGFLKHVTEIKTEQITK